MGSQRIDLPKEVDGIVIGSGHNGLIAANYLAKAGKQMLVLESQPTIGGGLSTEEITLPLFKHNLHAYFVRWTPNYRIWTDLEMSKYGLQTIKPDVQNVIPFKEGGALLCYSSLEKSLAEIRRFSVKDAETYERVYREFEEMTQQLVDPLRFAAPLQPDELTAVLQRSDIGRRYLRYTQYSALDLVRELFEHEAVRALVLFNVAVRAYLPCMDAPGTGYIVVLALFGMHHGAMIVGGSNEAPRALAARLFEYGGMVATRAKIARILVENNKAVGVETEDGRVVRAREFVLSNVPAAMTLTRMVEAQHVDSDVRAAMHKYHWNEEGLFGVHLALNGAICYGNSQPEDDINNSLNYCLGYETSDDFVRDMEWIRSNTLPTVGALHAASSTVFDPSQAPPGHGVAFAWQFAPNRTNGGVQIWNDALDREFGQMMIDSWAEYAPKIKEQIIGVGTHSLLNTVQYNPAMWLGDRHLGSYHPDNFDSKRPHPSLSNYRSPIDGLYHCGSDTYPGGSFTGQPGYNAATTIAQDLDIDIWWTPSDPRDVLPK